MDARLSPDFLARAVESAARDASAPWAAVVGGYVRNRLLDEPSADLDLVVPSGGAAVAGRTAAAIGGRVVPLSRWRQWEVFHKAWRVDVVEADDLQADLARRDFTVNAIAWWLIPSTYELFDPLGGLEDLEAARLELCSPGALEADPARIVRGARLVSGGFVPSPEVLRAASESAGLVGGVSRDRVWREWRRLSFGSDVAKALHFLLDCGALEVWLGGAVSPERAREGVRALEEMAGGERMAADEAKSRRPTGVKPDVGPGPGPAAVAMALLRESPAPRAAWMDLARRLGCTAREAFDAYGLCR